MYPKEGGRPFPPKPADASLQSPPPPWRAKAQDAAGPMGRPEDADRPMGKPASLEMKAAAKQYEQLTRKEKNAMRPGRSSGRLGK